MEAISLPSSILPHSLSFRKPCSQKTRFRRVFALENRGRLVDESGMILRRRIHEMKMMKRNYEAPEEWQGWERWYYSRYVANICDVVGILQSQLMNSRPSVALAMLAFLAFSIPTSVIVIWSHLLEVSNLGLVSEISMEISCLM